MASLLPALAAAERGGREIYLDACAACHGAGGRGAPHSLESFEAPPPDFTDCDFASREPDADWVAIAHEGGPVRGFSAMMPAFGDALSEKEISAAMEHVRTFCDDDEWPRGELNLPRPLVTAKAYPEDEAVMTLSVDAEGEGRVVLETIYEQRFGARNQFEIVVPLGWRERSPGEQATGDDTWGSAVGDVAFGLKRALHHDLQAGSIVSLAAEVLLPTGDEEEGFGAGTTRFEPYVSVGQILPADFFAHAQAGLELPLDEDEAQEEAFARVALGRSFTSGRFGRTWTPMIELLAGRELVSGAEVRWDAVPQLQVTLNRRQHVMLNLGVRAPVDDDEGRDTVVIVYLLWDWFDGGLGEGW